MKKKQLFTLSLALTAITIANAGFLDNLVSQKQIIDPVYKNNDTSIVEPIFKPGQNNTTKRTTGSYRGKKTRNKKTKNNSKENKTQHQRVKSKGRGR